MFINVVFDISGRDAVPIRAVPHLTGGHIGPRGIAQLLADPNQKISAYEFSATSVVTELRPKNWSQYKHTLAPLGPQDMDVATVLTTAKLPASTFVYLADLQQKYEELYLPPREDLTAYTDAEREDFQLQLHTHVPNELVDLVFEGFSTPLSSAAPTAPIPAPIQLPAVLSHGVTGGTSLKWTPERKSEARAMLVREKARSVKDYSARTAKEFGVSTARLREVLREEPKKVSSKKLSHIWPSSNQ